jgi:RNA polymerase-interacting CarD/CdnL/TRCF family regulator
MTVTEITYRKLNGEVKTYDCINITRDTAKGLVHVELFDNYGIRAASGKKPEYRTFKIAGIMSELVLN